jgi:hypothetical protein
MVSVPEPVLVSVTVCTAEAEPTLWLPKFTLVAESERVVVMLSVPLPESTMLCGDPVALSISLMDAANGPAVLGARRTRMMQEACDGRLVPQSFDVPNDRYCGPER